MILYTPLPPEAVWEGWGQPPPPRQQISLGNAVLEVEILGFRLGRVWRLHSTDPADYLRGPQPGDVLSW